MALTKAAAVAQTHILLGVRKKEAERLDRLHEYIHNKQRLLWLPSDVPQEVRRIAEMCRVNVLGLVVSSVAQSMYVDGYRNPQTLKDADSDEDAAWSIWQQNMMDARQTGVHRAMIGYDVAYVSVLPGDPAPVIRGRSPRQLTTLYGEDDTWPVWALEKLRSATTGQHLYRLFDDERAYYMSVDDAGRVEYISDEVHGAGVVPVVRFLAKSDLDDEDEVSGDLETDLIPLQDQINLTTFGLMVTQHYGAFPREFITGWIPENETEKLQAKQYKVRTFADPDVKVDQLPQADLGGYIDSRRDALRNLAAISQTPAHQLRGELVNLSAEALAAAEQAERRKVTEHQTMAGESWEQALALAGRLAGHEADPAAQVRWRDTEARAFAATVDGLGKLAKMLQIPVEELWEKVPGVTQQDVDRWKAARAQGDSLTALGALLDRQMGETVNI